MRGSATDTERLFRQAVLERLDELDRIAEAAEVSAPEEHLRRLAEGWRLLLTVHQPDQDSRCQGCPGVLRHQRWPCQVWQLAHRHLITEDRPGTGGGHETLTRLRGRSRRIDAGGEVIPLVPRRPAIPPVGGHLETDSRRIHRAAVVERPILEY